MMRPIAWLSLAIPVCGLVAQGAYVSPSHFRGAEGNFGLSHGLGNSANQNRFLQLILMNNPVRTITSIDLRRDADATGTWPATALVADMFVSTAAKSYPTHNNVFDVNHGSDKTMVADTAIFVFPETESGRVPHAWAYKFPFETPFRYLGKKPLCWEVLTHYTTSPNTLIFDAAGNWEDNPQPVSNAFGDGCIATGYSEPVLLQGGASASWLGQNETVTLGWSGSNLPPRSSVLLNVGMDYQSFAGLPLPFTMPGSEFSPSGPCTIYNDYALSIPVTTNASGSFNYQAKSVPSKGLSNGDALYGQVLALDPNAFYGFVLSNSLQHHIVAPFGSTLLISHSYLNGSHGDVGIVVSWQGLVVRVL